MEEELERQDQTYAAGMKDGEARVRDQQWRQSWFDMIVGSLIGAGAAVFALTLLHDQVDLMGLAIALAMGAAGITHLNQLTRDLQNSRYSVATRREATLAAMWASAISVVLLPGMTTGLISTVATGAFVVNEVVKKRCAEASSNPASNGTCG